MTDKKETGRPKSYTAEQVIEAIEGSGGIKATIAKKLGCHRHTVDNYLELYVTVKRAFDNEEEQITDMAESVVIAAIQDKDVNTAKWWIERRRKDRFGQKLDQNINIIEVSEQAFNDATPEQLQRISDGENPAIVLAKSSQSKAEDSAVS